jgi:hypothetical protein
MNQTLNQQWQIARDPENQGREEKWFERVPQAAQPAPVPGIIQQVFPDYHGVAWYWTRFTLPDMPTTDERLLLRFGAVDYLAEVWVNGVSVGGHEGGETPFELDATAAVRAGENLLAVRVLNPGNERIDGLVLQDVPRRHRIVPFKPGCCYNAGGILLPVEVASVPAIRIADVCARPDWLTGDVPVTVVVRNDTAAPARGRVEAFLGPRLSGEPHAATSLEADFPPGDSEHALVVTAGSPHLWSVDDPFLYLLDIAVEAERYRCRRSVRIGFRDFRVKDGWFLLNGKRVFFKSTHTCNHFPISQIVPPTPDLMRRDLIYAKTCGYNGVRFIAGVPLPEQLDCCDEIGLLVQEECLAGWKPPAKTERFDRNVREMVLRDRNHPSVAIWGLLNEEKDGPGFRHAVEALALVRELDSTRLVLLASGRWDGQLAIGSVSNPGSSEWECQWGGEAAGAAPSPFPPLAPCEGLANQTGGYMKDVGDAHVYPRLPVGPDATDFIRTLGQGLKPVFLSELGVGSLMDVIGETRHFEQAGCRADLPDYALIRGMAERLVADWKRWGFEGTYPFADDMLRDSQRLHMRQRRLCFDLVRSNPNLCGYNLTGMLDHGITGEGLWTYWRELKPLAAETLRDGWASLRWCLFVTPIHGYAERPVTVEAVLANEDVLPPGEYPVTFRITGPQGIVWEQTGQVVIPKPAPGGYGPLAVPVLKTTVQLDVPAGEYVFAARLERGGAPAGDRKSFWLSAAPAAQVSDSRTTVTAWGLSDALQARLGEAGVRLRPFSAGAAPTPEVILVGRPEAGDRDNWVDLVRRVSSGSVAVFLDCDAFRCSGDRTFWLPLARKGDCVPYADWLYHKEYVAKRHPIFEGLQAGGVLDWDYYGEVLAPPLFIGQEPPDEVVCAGFFPCAQWGDASGYISGLMLAANRLGAGWFIVNTLNIIGAVGRNPAADRLLLNLVRDAQRRMARSRTTLAPDFGSRVVASIYPPHTPFKTAWELALAPVPAVPIAAAELPAKATAWVKSGRRFEADGLVSFHAVAPKQGGIMYARGGIEAPAAMTCDLLIGTDSPLKVWLDGQEVGIVPTATNPAIADSTRFPVTLTRGRHTLVVAHDRRDGIAWGFFLRLTRTDRELTLAEQQEGNILTPNVNEQDVRKEGE